MGIPLRPHCIDKVADSAVRDLEIACSPSQDRPRAVFQITSKARQPRDGQAVPG